MVNLFEELKKDEYYIEVLKEYIEKRKELSEDFNASEIRKSILSGWDWSIPRMSLIPKSTGNELREIYIFNERDSFLQKVINKILFACCGDKIDDNVFSYQKGVRTFDAAKYVQTKLMNKELYGVKVDISNFFLSVNKEHILKCVNELIEDKSGRELLAKLFNTSSYEHKGNIYEKYLAIMPGCAVSSFFANYVLKDLDESMKSKCDIYARYSDDIVFFCKSEEEVKNVLKEFSFQLSELGLKFNDNKLQFFSNDDVVDFLGLEITGNYIDVSKATFNKTKKFIKKICNDYRRKCELQNRDRNLKIVQKAITTLNRCFYNSLLYDRSSVKGGRLRYIFSNVTTDKTLKELDYYLKDRLRYLYTGKNNKGNIKVLSNGKLKELGMVSMVQFYNLYKMDKDICSNEIALIGSETYNESVSSFYFPTNNLLLKNKDLSRTVFNGTFSDLYYNILRNNGWFYFNGVRVYAEYIMFDVEQKVIYFEEILIAENNELKVREFYCNLYGKDYLFKIRNEGISSLNDDNPNRLLKLYLASSYRQDFSGDEKRVDMAFKHKKYFREYHLNDLLTEWSENDLKVSESRDKRIAWFNSYLYFHVCSDVRWKGLSYEGHFIKYKAGRFYIVMKKEWFEREGV